MSGAARIARRGRQCPRVQSERLLIRVVIRPAAFEAIAATTAEASRGIGSMQADHWLKAFLALRWRRKALAMNERLLMVVVLAVLLQGNAKAGPLEACAGAFDRQDYAAALQLCRPLAEQGDARAQFSIGGMYYNGQGVRQDYVEAAEWTRKSAKQGYAPAQAHLGVMYWNGQGVPQDAVRAYMWLHLAAAQEPDAVGKRDAAASQMSPDEIAEAQRLAREWKPTTLPP